MKPIDIDSNLWRDDEGTWVACACGEAIFRPDETGALRCIACSKEMRFPKQRAGDDLLVDRIGCEWKCE